MQPQRQFSALICMLLLLQEVVSAEQTVQWRCPSDNTLIRKFVWRAPVRAGCMGLGFGKLFRVQREPNVDVAAKRRWDICETFPIPCTLLSFLQCVNLWVIFSSLFEFVFFFPKRGVSYAKQWFWMCCYDKSNVLLQRAHLSTTACVTLSHNGSRAKALSNFGWERLAFDKPGWSTDKQATCFSQ